ncbi:MAG: hypothetical protein QY322_00655 [bacterium]|nr:MAG: hypothetical protein QY322_00655 [bacterium]
MKTKRILILEDDILTLSKIFDALYKIETAMKLDLSVIVLSEYIQVEKYINKDLDVSFDLILLDRDCKLGGSFHVLDFKKFVPNKIVGISSVPDYNQALIKHGITQSILKEYSKLDQFAISLEDTIKTIFS